jgi:hypothetical protein
MPMSEYGNANPTILSIDEVELETNYAMLISTNSGLWRYIIGDTVKFTSLYPHKIQVTGRTKHFINVFGEEVMVENTDKALAITCEKTAAVVSEYTVGPIYLTDGKGGHEWVIEFEKEPESLSEFSRILDQELQNINSDYEAKRFKSIALEQLIIRKVSKGSFHQWLKSKGKFGGQHKVPRLSNTRNYVEELKIYFED